MSKKLIRLLCLTLALVMTLAVFVSCESNNANKNDDDETAEETTTKKASNDKNNGGSNDSDDAYDTGNSPIEKKDYDETFNYLVLNDTFTFEYFYAEERLYNEMNDSVYDRQLNVETNLGIDITAKKSTDYLGYSDEFMYAVICEDNEYQLCLTHCVTGVASFVTGGYLYDFKKLDSVDLNQNYWNKSLMNSVSYNGQYLLGYGDMCLANVNVVAFNKHLLERYVYSVYGGGFGENDTIYDLVEDNKWTLAKLGELASYAHEDLNGDGKKDSSDQYGLTGMFWVEASSFLHASNVNISKYNAETKKYELCINNTRTQQIIDKVAELYNAEYAYFVVPDALVGNHTPVSMKTNRTLFELTNSYKLMELKGTNVDYGVLPYPLYDENQENYRSLSWNGYMVVPCNIEKISDAEMVSDTLELLQYYSKPVTTAFYEKLLGAQVSESPDDAYMLKIIWESQVSDFAMAYADTDMSNKPFDALVYIIPRIVLNTDNVSNFEGYWAKWKGAARKQLEKIQTS